MLNTRVITENDQLEIVKRYQTTPPISQKELAALYDCSHSTIFKLLKAHGAVKATLTAEQKRVRFNEKRNYRYHTDADYRAKQQKISREKQRQVPPEVRRARMNKRYAENPEYREYIREHGKRYRAAKKAEREAAHAP